MNDIIKLTKGIITIKLDGLEEKTVERYRKDIHQLMIRKVFEIKSGKAILHFDADKNLRQIEIHITPFRT